MKISKSKLKQIIKEELQAVLAEGRDDYYWNTQERARLKSMRHQGSILGDIADLFKPTPMTQRNIDKLKMLHDDISRALGDGDSQGAKNLAKYYKSEKFKAEIDRIPALKYLRKKLPILAVITIYGGGTFAFVYGMFARAKTPEDYEKATKELVKVLKTQKAQDELTALTGVGGIAQMVRDAFEAIGAPDDDRINPGGKPMTMAQRRAALKMGPSARDQARARELALKYGTKN
tara:strand:- start:246 stop:944 length:699 start_codon:yes stop_codon:yes gene_type:complete